jgi:hypothetical protein
VLPSPPPESVAASAPPSSPGLPLLDPPELEPLLAPLPDPDPLLAPELLPEPPPELAPLLETPLPLLESPLPQPAANANDPQKTNEVHLPICMGLPPLDPRSSTKRRSPVQTTAWSGLKPPPTPVEERSGTSTANLSNNEAYATALESSSSLWVIPVAKAGER